MLGYPEAALADTENALNDVREIGQAATLMYALVHASITHIYCGNYAAANAEADELLALADEEGALHRKPVGMLQRGSLFALTGKAADAVQMIISGLTAWRSTGARGGRRRTCHIWRAPRNSANLVTLGTVSPRRWPRSK